MKAIKFLQFSTVGMFILLTLSSVAIMWFKPDKLDDLKKVIEIIWPFFVAEVVPALIGTPLTEAVRNLTGKKNDVNDGK